MIISLKEALIFPVSLNIINIIIDFYIKFEQRFFA